MRREISIPLLLIFLIFKTFSTSIDYKAKKCNINSDYVDRPSNFSQPEIFLSNNTCVMWESGSFLHHVVVNKHRKITNSIHNCSNYAIDGYFNKHGKYTLNKN